MTQHSTPICHIQQFPHTTGFITWSSKSIVAGQNTSKQFTLKSREVEMSNLFSLKVFIFVRFQFFQRKIEKENKKILRTEIMKTIY